MSPNLCPFPVSRFPPLPIATSCQVRGECDVTHADASPRGEGEEHGVGYEPHTLPSMTTVEGSRKGLRPHWTLTDRNEGGRGLRSGHRFPPSLRGSAPPESRPRPGRATGRMDREPTPLRSELERVARLQHVELQPQLDLPFPVEPLQGGVCHVPLVVPGPGWAEPSRAGPDPRPASPSPPPHRTDHDALLPRPTSKRASEGGSVCESLSEGGRE